VSSGQFNNSNSYNSKSTGFPGFGHSMPHFNLNEAVQQQQQQQQQQPQQQQSPGSSSSDSSKQPWGQPALLSCRLSL
ncbi:unnamed protein product, partial [Polarella glacialis]